MDMWKIKQAVKKCLSSVGLYNRSWWTPPKEKILSSLNASTGAKFFEVFESQPVDLPQAKVSGCPPIRFMAEPLTRFPVIGMFRVDNARVYCSFGAILDASDNIIPHTLWLQDTPSQIRLPLPPEKMATTPLKGVSLSLLSESAEGNYGHFLLDGIGRLAILAKHDASLIEKVDNVIVSGSEKPWKVRLLSQFGIDRKKIRWLDGNKGFVCDVLWASSFPGAKRTYPHWLPSYFRESCVGRNVDVATAEKNSRLFFIRKGTGRKLLNESELLSIANEFGFQAYDPLCSENSIEDFRLAEAVIAPHGAGMADIAFMEKGTKVLELMPSDHRHCYFFTLALAAELDYTVMIGKSTGERCEDAFGPSPYDFSIDKVVFRRYLEKEFAMQGTK
ncbi:hypothetical protein KUL118_04470 [Tenacibaculum sp. KUL118]|nr:hypothetical protein KUL118_04470 [Tenacibaculum sp. KUL118]